MNYFTVLGVVFGTIALLKPVYIHLIPYDENKAIAKAYAEKRPAWIVPVVLTGFMLVLLTWYVELTTAYPYSIILTLLFSLTAIKGMVLLFNYKRFHRWVANMLSREKGKDILKVNLGASLFGLAMIILTLVIF